MGEGAVKSPDGAIEMTVSTDGGQLAYRVTYRGKPVIEQSALGLEWPGTGAGRERCALSIADRTGG